MSEDEMSMLFVINLWLVLLSMLALTLHPVVLAVFFACSFAVLNIVLLVGDPA